MIINTKKFDNHKVNVTFVTQPIKWKENKRFIVYATLPAPLIYNKKNNAISAITEHGTFKIKGLNLNEINPKRTVFDPDGPRSFNLIYTTKDGKSYYVTSYSSPSFKPDIIFNDYIDTETNKNTVNNLKNYEGKILGIRSLLTSAYTNKILKGKTIGDTKEYR